MHLFLMLCLPERRRKMWFQEGAAGDLMGFLSLSPSQSVPSPCNSCGARSWVQKSAGKSGQSPGMHQRISWKWEKMKWGMFNSPSPTPLLCCSLRSKNPDSQLSLLPRGRLGRVKLRLIKWWFITSLRVLESPHSAHPTPLGAPAGLSHDWGHLWGDFLVLLVSPGAAFLILGDGGGHPGNPGGDNIPFPYGEMLLKMGQHCQECRKRLWCHPGARAEQGFHLAEPQALSGGAKWGGEKLRLHGLFSSAQRRDCCFLPCCVGSGLLISAKCLLWRMALICSAGGTGLLLNGGRE